MNLVCDIPKSFPNVYKSCIVKLTPAKIRWIIRERERGELTAEQIAWIQRITPRRVDSTLAGEGYRRTTGAKGTRETP